MVPSGYISSVLPFYMYIMFTYVLVCLTNGRYTWSLQTIKMFTVFIHSTGTGTRNYDTSAYVPSTSFHKAFSSEFAPQQQMIKTFSVSLSGLWKFISLHQHQLSFKWFPPFQSHSNLKMKYWISAYILCRAVIPI